MPTCIYVCHKCDGNGPLLKALRQRTDASIVKVGCQKVCEEPVAGLVVNHRMEWFGKLDGDKAVDAVVTLVRDRGNGKVPATLEKRRDRKRSGRGPR
ncbi:MAG: hypothetical protein ACRDYV_00300 [Acidimicrobiia bacterium]